MSAAANAAGYLYAHGQLAVADHEGQAEAALAPKGVVAPARSKADAPARTPRIEYRKRRLYALPSAA